MRNADTILPDITNAVRWIARIGGVVLICLILFSFFHEGGELKFSSLAPGEKATMICLLVAFVGLIVGWFSEGLGGLLTLVALITFSVIDYYSREDILLHVWVLGIPAILFLICWKRDN